ncbi:MAG TPA: glycosyltransferase [Bryobacterales bacterium]|nr:glycosyltransferase [Bryobacterales bacterium]
MSRPLLSVIVSAYNMATFVRESLESALAQTWENIEVIVVDDGSSDDTARQLRAIEDDRLRCYYEPHRGHAAAVNTGIAAAAGSYVAFLDADDLWAPAKIETHLRFHEQHPEADMTFSLSSTIDEHGRVLDPPPISGGGPVSLRELLVENVVRNGSAAVLRRDALDRVGWFDAGLKRCGDLDLWLRIALLRPNNIHCIPEVLTHYRRRPSQLSSDWRQMRTGWERVVAKAQMVVPDLVSETRREREVNNYRYFASLAYEAKQFREGLGLLLKGFRRSPFLFLRDSRNPLVGAACLAGFLLPAGVQAGLDRYARRIRWKAAAG